MASSVLARLRLMLFAVALVALRLASAGEVSVTYLALEGDGTASVIVDGPVAYLADGGRAGMRGVGGATLGGMSVPAYLESRQITDVVMSCSHPHDDHMAGLVTLLKSGALAKFKLHFVDNFRGTPGARESLADIHQAAAAKDDVHYVSANNKNAFAELPRGSTIQVRNFVYQPEEIGTHDHDASLIMEYAFGSNSSEKVVVDFDDASEKLIRTWARSGRRVTTVVVPHHGSKKNRISVILAEREKFGLTDAIVTVNRRNQYGHPDPDILLDLVQRLGVDHVFLTDSDRGRNISINANGDISAENRKVARERLQAYAKARQQLLEGRLQSAIDNLQERLNVDDVRRIEAMSFSPRQKLEMLTDASTLTEQEKGRLRRLLRGTEAMSAVASLAAGNDNISKERFAAKVAAVRAHVGAAGSRKANRDDGLPAHHATGSGRPAPDAPGPESPRPGPDTPGPDGAGGGGGGGNDGLRQYLQQAKQAEGDMRARNPTVHAKSDRASMRSALFHTSMRTTRARFGGVIVGNKARGPEPVEMEYLFVPDGEALNSDYGDKDGAYVLRFKLRNGEVADFTGFSNQDLWAAVNFVQPMGPLRDRLTSMGVSSQINASIGMVGINSRMPFSRVFPYFGGWEFSVHPALSHSSVAVDAMRLDMLLSVVKAWPPGPSAAETPVAAPIIAAWRRMKFSTYQWYDASLDLKLENGQLTALPIEGAGACAMRLRLIDSDKEPNYPGWYKPQDPVNSVEAELARVKALQPERFISDSQSRELRAKLWGLVDDAELRVMVSEPPADLLQATCKEFDALAHVDRFAKLVAVLNWYKDHKGDLPELAFQPHMRSRDLVLAQLRHRDVLPSSIPLVSWSGLLVSANLYFMAIYALLVLTSVVFLLIAVAKRLSRQRGG